MASTPPVASPPASANLPAPIDVVPPAGGFDRAGVRALLAEGPLAKTIHRIARAPFGHTVTTLRIGRCEKPPPSGYSKLASSAPNASE